MPWGTAEGLTGRTETNNVQVQQKLDNVGNVVELQTYGGTTDISEEGYIDKIFVNEAVNGQSGKEVVNSHEKQESNADWQKFRKSKQKVMTAGTPIPS